jgi:N-acyl amino acid synthase of PEP-CTERM/exosortase system
MNDHAHLTLSAPFGCGNRDAGEHYFERNGDRELVGHNGKVSQLEVVQAATSDDKCLSYRLRYEVYCVEHSFLNAADYPDGLERDEFDSHSLHALLRHKPTNDFVGTVRLIMPKPGTRKPIMPFAKLCRDARYRAGEILPVDSTAEISRFAISKAFRSRVSSIGESDQQGRSSAAARRLMPLLSLGLIHAITKMALENGISHVCAVMEPALLRLLSRLGVEFKALGPPVDYHGIRQPCYARMLELLDQLRFLQPKNWAIVTSDGRFVSCEEVALRCAERMPA